MEKFILATQKGLYITILYFLLTSFACSPAPSVTATSAPSATATLLPSHTDTPVPTLTVQPSATPIPSATPTPLIADLGQVIFSESFEDLDFPFNVYSPKRIESEILVLEQQGGIYGISAVPPGVTTIILLKTTGVSQFNIGYHTGEYGTESIRRFSFNAASGRWDLYDGNITPHVPAKFWNARQVRGDTWHYFLIKRSANGDMDAKIWERDKPETMFQFHGNLGPEWGTLELTFFVDFREGSFMLDEYQDLK